MGPYAYYSLFFQLQFNKSTYFENILRVEKYESLQKLKQLREPVKKGE